jgi:hypothetical protein
MATAVACTAASFQWPAPPSNTIVTLFAVLVEEGLDVTAVTMAALPQPKTRISSTRSKLAGLAAET